MKKFLSIVIVLLIVFGQSVGQKSRKRLPAKSKGTSVAKASVNLQAGLVYQNGTQMVSRTLFSLLDEDLGKILFDAGLKPDDASMSAKFNELSGTSNPSDRFRGYVLRDVLRGANFDTLAKALQPHIKTQATTDFNGNAQFVDISPGIYYVYGQTQTRERYGMAFWNLMIEVKAGVNQVILDQNNMVQGSY